MKRQIWRLCCLALALSLTLWACGHETPPPSAAPTDQAIRLTVLSINDFHGQVDARPIKSRESPGREVLVGGAEALAATIAELRAQNPRGTLLLDGGDFMQGSLVSNHFEGAPVRELYRLLRFDATVIGNHEFDFGPVGKAVVADSPGPRSRGALRAWVEKAPFPVLSANIVDHNGRSLSWRNLRGHLIVQRAGVRIGIVGLTTAHTPETTLRANVSDLRFQSLYDTALREGAALRRAKVDVRILLAHAGGSCQGDAPSSCRGEIFDLVRRLPPKTFDLVVSAHSHRCLRHRIEGTPVIQACALGAAVGRVDLFVQKGRPNESKIFLPRPVCQQVFADDGSCEAWLRKGPQRSALVDNPLLKRFGPTVEAVGEALAPFRRATRSVEQKILARFARPLKHEFHGGSGVGYLFAKMMKQAIAGADVAIVNGGGIRGHIGVGPLSYGDLYRIFPFDNRLATVRLSGRELRALIEASLSRRHGGVLQAAGIGVEIRCSPDGKRELVALKDDRGRPIGDDRRLVVVLADFLLSGGDGLAPVVDKIPASRKKVYVGRLIREEMARYLLARSEPLNSVQAPVLKEDTPSVRLSGEACGSPPQPQRPLCR